MRYPARFSRIAVPLVALCCLAAGSTQKIFIDNGQKKKIEIEVEVARSPQERAQGLMFRRALPKNQGMLFVFGEESKAPFWMKNTVISLDMLFVDAKIGRAHV